MNGIMRWALLAAMASSGVARAELFTFGATLRAGAINGGGFEIAGGNSSGAPFSATGDVNPYWADWPASHSFRIAYTEATNTVSVTVRNALNALIGQISFNPANGGTVPSGRTYTINPPGMYVSVSPQNPNIASAIVVSNLALSPGVTILQPFTATTLSAARVGNTTATSSLSNPISFQTAAGFGNWYLDGTIQFLGLGAHTPGGVTGARSQFHFNVTGENTVSPVPEPGTWAMMGGGLLLVALGSFRRRS